MGNETRSETEQFEYLFLDLEWNQPIGTTELTDRAAVQIAIVAVDEAMNPVKSFSRAIRLRNPESLNSHTVKIIHMPEYNIMQGRSREEVMESVRQTFPAYKHIVVWTRDTYDLFKRDMRECGIAMCKHRVVVLQDVLAVIAGSGQGKIRFEHALQCAEIEYELNYLHHSKHDANYLYQLFTKCYSQYFKLTREEYCDTNIFSGKMHFAKCRYVRKFQPEVILLKPKSSIFMGYTPCKVCACQVEWKRFDWIVLTNIQGKNGINLRNLYPTEKNIEIEKHEKDICNHVKNDTDEMPFLDYIFTIDIFNEGVDIPEINQVLMLRPTESPIVFVQQLGRGLRKAEGKEHVVIIDFIGNYTNNYMIPIALSGDRSYNKDSIRRYVSEGTRIIPGASTIHFDEISRKRIFQSIDSARMNDVKLLRESFEQLKYRLGRIPSILDFRKYGSIDVNKYFVKFDSYYAFLVKYYSDEYKVRLTPEEASIIEFLSKKVTNMKRIYELALLQQLLQQRRRVFTYYEKTLEITYHKKLNLQTEESVVRNLTNEFPKEEERKKYKDCVLIKKSSEGYVLEDKFEKMLNENLEFLKMVDELIQYGIENYQENYSDSYKDTDFQLYQKYTYEDVCRLLNWQRNMNAQNIGGYFYDATTKTLPVFINYDKAEDAIAYEDRFVTRENLIALSKHPRKVNSSDADHFFKRTESDKENKILLFVRKNKDDKEAKEFYFLGEVFAQGEPIPIKMEKTGDDAFEINYKLDVPVREDIYEYIVSEA